jgi:hypothetical protein
MIQVRPDRRTAAPAAMFRRCTDGPGRPDDGHPFYQTVPLFVSLEDAGLDEACQAIAHVARRGGADALD